MMLPEPLEQFIDMSVLTVFRQLLEVWLVFVDQWRLQNFNPMNTFLVYGGEVVSSNIYCLMVQKFYLNQLRY